MKKCFILVVILFLIIVCNNSSEQTEMVFEYNKDDMLTVNIIIPGLSTKNFEKYFDEYMEIIGIYPKINLIYKNKVGNIFYSFNRNNIKEDLLSFTKYYKSILKKNNFNSDLILSDYNGINIEKVRVYLTYEKLNEILKECSGCSYEKISYGD